MTTQSILGCKTEKVNNMSPANAEKIDFPQNEKINVEELQNKIKYLKGLIKEKDQIILNFENKNLRMQLSEEDYEIEDNTNLIIDEYERIITDLMVKVEKNDLSVNLNRFNSINSELQIKVKNLEERLVKSKFTIYSILETLANNMESLFASLDLPRDVFSLKTGEIDKKILNIFELFPLIIKKIDGKSDLITNLTGNIAKKDDKITELEEKVITINKNSNFEIELLNKNLKEYIEIKQKLVIENSELLDNYNRSLSNYENLSEDFEEYKKKNTETIETLESERNHLKIDNISKDSSIENQKQTIQSHLVQIKEKDITISRINTEKERIERLLKEEQQNHSNDVEKLNTERLQLQEEIRLLINSKEKLRSENEILLQEYERERENSHMHQQEKNYAYLSLNKFLILLKNKYSILESNNYFKIYVKIIQLTSMEPREEINAKILSKYLNLTPERIYSVLKEMNELEIIHLDTNSKLEIYDRKIDFSIKI